MRISTPGVLALALALALTAGLSPATAADVKVGLEDLTPAKQAELKRAGVNKLTLALTVEVPPLAAGAAPWGKPVGPARWTYPSDVKTHLIGEHKLNPGLLEGMTREQLEAVHDALHDAEVAKAAPVAAPPPARTVAPYMVLPNVQNALGRPAAMVCPPGGCPATPVYNQPAYSQPTYSQPAETRPFRIFRR